MSGEAGAKVTAFVSHYDCARHDTGWNHPEHQGRLPAVMRAVYQDMLTLFDPLLEVEGRHAGPADLELVHTPEYLARIRGWVDDAVARGRPVEVEPGIVVSDASWEAATAAAGSVLVAIDTVLAGTARNAFCAVRPPGRDAGPRQPGGFGLVNSVAIGARYLVSTLDVAPVLVLEWGGGGPSQIRAALESEQRIRVARIQVVEDRLEKPGEGADRAVPAGAGGGAVQEALEALLTAAAAQDPPPRFVLLSAGFDLLDSDPIGRLSVQPDELYELTAAVRAWADETCGGRLVSVLEGGYDPPALGTAVVQHLRAMAGLPRAE